jgi:hypothetical protein
MADMSDRRFHLPPCADRLRISRVKVGRGLTSVAVAACLLVAGCGGDDSDDGTDNNDDGTNWVQQANGICQEAQEKFASLPEEPGLGPDTPANRKSAEITEEKLERLRAIAPPDDAAEDFNRMLDLNEKAFAMSDEFLAAVKAGVEAEGDSQAQRDNKAALLARSVKLGNEQRRLQREAARLARNLGLTTCGRT